MLIAISQRNDKNKYGDFVDNLENNYVDYLEKFGVEVVIIPNSTKNIDIYFKKISINGVILSGGNDINPELYGGKIKDGLSISDKRDMTEKAILETAIKKKMPVLGICRGMQFINVFFKGKLVDIREGMGVNHDGVTHPVKIKDDDAAKFFDKKEFVVNSYHNQGVNKNILSSELYPFAICEDGIIEGICHTSLPIAGIQWHPERESPDEASNKKIINAFLWRKLFWRS